MQHFGEDKHVFFSFSEWVAPLQVQYELITGLHQQSNKIYLIVPDRLIARDSSELSNKKLGSILRKKSNMQQFIDKLADLSSVELHRVDYSGIKLSKFLNEFNFPFLLDLEFIKNIECDGFFIGNEILSTLSNYYNLALFDKVKFHRFAVIQMFRSYLSVYFFALNFLREHDVDLVYVFNGRLIHERAVINACLKLGVPFKTYELAEKEDSYILTRGEILNIDHFNKLIRSHFNENFTISKMSDINSWYEKRASKSSKALSVITDNLNLSFIEPEVHELLNSKIVLTFFAGSVDELIFMDHSHRQVFQTQEEALMELYKQVRDHNKNIKIVVRSHPKMRYRPKREQNSWSKFLSTFEDVYEIKPNSPTDSYELIRLSEYVTVFHSTMGVESRYLNRKTLILGDAIYSRLPGLSPIKNISDIKDFLGSSRVEADRTGINMFGFFMNSFGTRFENYLNFDNSKTIVNFLLKLESYIYLKRFSVIHFLINLNFVYHIRSRK